MGIYLEDDGDVVLNLSDESNIDLISYLKTTYGSNGDLFTSYLNIFQLLGITDTLFIFDTMNHIARVQFSYNSEKNCINQDSNIIALHERSKIKLDEYYYAILSDIHIYFCICDYTFLDKEHITSGDVDLLLDGIDIIYAKLGQLYTEIMLNPKQQKQIQEIKIQSLGGRSRAEKYTKYKNEILNAWQNGAYHSYAQFARKHADKYQLSTKTIENWLSKEFSNQQ